MTQIQNETDLDSVTQEVISYKLKSIADEMQSTLIKSAYSSIIKESQDATSALFDPQGRTIAQAEALPCHLGMLIPAVNAIIDEFPPEEMNPGDVYLMNDPYHGGTHLPDIAVVAPVHHDDEVIALGTTMAHHQDVGGKVPGSVPTDSTEVYQEGLRLPPVKLYDGGEPNDELFSVLELNSRTPDTFLGDLNAQISAGKTANRRLTNLADQYGHETTLQAFDGMIDHSDTLTRFHLDEIPDGEYSFVDWVDDDGINRGQPVRVEVTVTIDGSDMMVDFTGSSEQAEGPINSTPGSTIASVYYAVYIVTDPDIPKNAGCFEPVSISLPEGSVVNPRPPAPVNARGPIIKCIADVVMGAFAKAVPDRIPAAGSRQGLVMHFAGKTDDGGQWIYSEAGAGGHGARPTKDGIDCIDTDVTNTMNTPTEAIELHYPVRVWKYELWEDSGGPGRHRGGLGYHRQIETLTDDVRLAHRTDRHQFQPWGLQGGNPAPKCKTVIDRNNGDTEELAGLSMAVLQSGDVLNRYSTGGGGYGPPEERPLSMVSQDLLQGKVSPTAAEEKYGVILDDDGTIDELASEERRSTRTTSTHRTVDRGELPGGIEE